MPHRAGYFVLAYSWDHHCRELLEIIEQKFHHVERELSELERKGVREMDSLLNYYKKWHYNNELYRATMNDIKARESVVEKFGYRGYGVNRDLQKALASVRERRLPLEGCLKDRFLQRVGRAQEMIYLPRELVNDRRSDYIIAELCMKLGKSPEGNIPKATDSPPLDLDRYFRIMSDQPWQVNMTVFQKMFMRTGLSSRTIMRGSTGLHELLSCHQLKLVGNRNLVEGVRTVFSGLHAFTDIGIGLVKKIHYMLSRELDPKAGCFREIDFPDRNGVTFEFGNFQKEMDGLSVVLAETGKSFHDVHEFIRNLARSYYMLIGIHPFWDGNGRVGRFFVNHLLLKKGLPPVELNDREEIFALPRYGGSMEDMYNYLKKRLRKAIDTYYYEISRLQSSDFQGKAFHNVSFDSGFRFSQTGDSARQIEVEFDAYVIEQQNDLARMMKDDCRIVFPDKKALENMTVYCGFCSAPFSEWHYRFSLRRCFLIRELESEIEGALAFNLGFIISVPDQARHFKYFSCSVVSEGKGLIFNNKGLNYSYNIRK